MARAAASVKSYVRWEYVASSRPTDDTPRQKKHASQLPTEGFRLSGAARMPASETKPVKLQAVLACLGWIALSGSACVLDARDGRAEATFSRTLTVAASVDLDVRTGSGDIQIRGGPTGTVTVQGRVRESWVCWSGLRGDEQVRRVAADPPVEQSGNVIRLGDFRQLWARSCVSVSFDVKAPPDAGVRARSGSGRQIVTGIRGPVDVHAGSGDVRIGSTDGDVRAVTGSGDIEVEDGRGSVFARAGSGSINVTGVEGDVEVHTGSGRVSVNQTTKGRTEITTGSGGIAVADARGSLRLRAASGSVAVDGEPAGSWRIGTASGNVTVRVPASAAFDLDARTASGSIDSAHPMTVLRNHFRRQLHGQVRGGGPSVDVSTASGSIRIQ